jgi:hypothetical protein
MGPSSESLPDLSRSIAHSRMAPELGEPADSVAEPKSL